ncbi:MAG: glycosyltransferase [Candidatus Eisenbacteria bacterium]|nr:glycosyltransferase [Candidatus Eisenbacteria bacterium]
MTARGEARGGSSGFTSTTSARIAIVGPSYPFRGGNALFVAHLYESLRRDHETYIASFKRLYPELLFPGKTQMNRSHDPVKMTPSRQIIDSIGPLSWWRAARWIAEPARRPDLAVFVWWNPFFGPAYGTIARALRRRTDCGIVFVAENVVSHENRFVDQYLTRYALSQADYFIVLSSVVRSRIHSLYPTVPIRQAALPVYDCYMPEGVDREEARRALGLSRPTILFFGYVRAYKGLDQLLRAMPRVASETDAELLIVGEFYDSRAKYDQLIQELGIGDRVRIVDQHVPDEDVARYFSAADVVALPYLSATQSGITQIAFACGVPVISTNVGGLPEVVADGSTGLIVEPRSPDALGEALVRYFREDLAERFRANVAVEARRDRAGDLLRTAVRDFLEMERTR